MNAKRLSTLLVSTLAAGGIVAACGGSAQSVFSDGPGAGAAGGPGGGPGGMVNIGDASANELNDAAVCTGTVQKGEVAPVDILLLVDKSYSMDFPSVSSKWQALKAALGAFTSNTSFAGLGLGIQYFPSQVTCDVGGYAQPDVPVDLLPGVGPAVMSSLASQKPSGGTPLAPAMEGVMTYALARANANPARKVVIALATDGSPDSDCSDFPNTIAKAVSIVASGLSAPHPVSTFVIAVGSNLGVLDAIAAAGGSGQALVIDETGDMQQEFLADLTKIRKEAIGCEYAIPPPPKGNTLDFNKINVLYASSAPPPGQPYEALGRVSDAASCATNPRAWYYDNAASPKYVILCGGVCAEAIAAASPVVDVQLGCTTLLR